MKFSVRLEYLKAAFVDLLRLIGNFICMIVIPGIIGFGLLILMSYIPGWASALIIMGLAAVIYIWVRADERWERDCEISEATIRNKHWDIKDIIDSMVREGKSSNMIYNLVTPMIDEYNSLLECHKERFGEDGDYKCYHGRLEKYLKECMDYEETLRQQQEERAAELKVMGGNAEIPDVQ